MTHASMSPAASANCCMGSPQPRTLALHARALRSRPSPPQHHQPCWLHVPGIIIISGSSSSSSSSSSAVACHGTGSQGRGGPPPTLPKPTLPKLTLRQQGQRVQREVQRAQQDPRQSMDRARTTEVFRLVKLAFPILLQYITANVTYLVNTGYVGHLSKPELLSGLVLAASLSTATGYNIISGISTATETVCGQAYGAKNFNALNETLQRALLICVAACVPIGLLWNNSEGLLMHLGQPQSIAHGAASYLHIVTPALLFYAVHDCIDRFLISQGVTKPSLIIAVLCSALTPLLSWFFVAQQGLGLEGAGFAYLGVQAANALLSIGYLWWRGEVEMKQNPPENYLPLRPSRGALNNWGPYIALAVPAIISYCVEGWACEVLIFFAGTLPNAEVAVGVTGLTLQFSTFVWLTAASFASATSFTVANKLGAGDAVGAQSTAKTAVATVFVTQCAIGLTGYHFREPLLRLLSDNPEVLNLSLAVMPTLAWCFVADGLTAVQGGVLRGAGRQWWAAGLNLAGWWVVGVPLAYFFSHTQGWNVTGLWAGFATASIVQASIQSYVINKKLNWDTEVDRAEVLLSASSDPNQRQE